MLRHTSRNGVIRKTEGCLVAFNLHVFDAADKLLCRLDPGPIVRARMSAKVQRVVGVRPRRACISDAGQGEGVVDGECDNVLRLSNCKRKENKKAIVNWMPETKIRRLSWLELNSPWMVCQVPSHRSY